MKLRALHDMGLSQTYEVVCDTIEEQVAFLEGMKQLGVDKITAPDADEEFP